MDCFDNKDTNINDYCELCKILVNFTYELYQVTHEYINNGGNIDDLESVCVDTYIKLFRQACKRWCLNIDDVKTKQLAIEDKYYDLFQLIYNLPEDKHERELFIEQQSGYAVIQISKKPLVMSHKEHYS